MGRDVRLCSDGRMIFNAADRIANRVNGACSKFEQASPALAGWGFDGLSLHLSTALGTGFGDKSDLKPPV